MASEVANNTAPIVTPDAGLPGGHRLEVIVANELGIPGGPVTIEDGGDVALGATTDAAATAGGAGSVSAKLRRATTQLAALGALTDAAVTDPAAASASIPALLRGILDALNDIAAVLADVHDGTAHALRTTA